nr:hypothetical protein [uncultured Pseudomonas sp.]
MKIKSLLAGLSFTSLASLANATLLYDVPFASPPNISGEKVAIDASSQTPSAIVFGEPVMQSNFAGLPGNWAVFNTPTCGAYEQIRFDLPGDTKKITLSYDIDTQYLNNSDNNFAVLIDSTGYSGRSINLHGGNNRMYLFNSGSFFFDTFVDQRTYRMDIVADVLDNSLTISVDGFQKYSGPLGSTDLKSIRMSLSPWTGAASICDRSNVAVSNIKVETPDAPVEPPIEPPVVDTVTADISLYPGSPSVVGPNGGDIRFRRIVKNINDSPSSIRYWVYAASLDGSAYPLNLPYTTTLYPGQQTNVLGTFSVPAWFPAGQYSVRLMAVDLSNGQLVSDSLPFTKAE